MTTNHVLLQSFNWTSNKSRDHFKIISNNLPYYKKLGISQLWLPPVSSSHTVEGYFPDDYYNLNSSYGNKQDLYNLINDCNEIGINALADIVSWECIPNVCRDKYNFNGTLVESWDKYKYVEELIKYIKWLKCDVGFGGFRLDFIKGLGESSVRYILENVPDTLFIGELWETMNYEDGHLSKDQNIHQNQLLNFAQNVGNNLCMFDFTTKGCLQEAFYTNDYTHLSYSNHTGKGLNAVMPKNAYTFLDNHDTGSTQNHWPFPYHNIVEGYAYIMTHPGTPCVFWDHLYLEQLPYLLEIHKQNKSDDFSIIACEKDYYIAKCVQYIFELGSPSRYGNYNIIFEYNNCRIYQI